MREPQLYWVARYQSVRGLALHQWRRHHSHPPWDSQAFLAVRWLGQRQFQRVVSGEEFAALSTISNDDRAAAFLLITYRMECRSPTQ
jgi:hypothetical protein